MPDFFVPLDTSGITPYFNKVSNRNLIYRFAFDYTDKHRKEMANLKDYKAIEALLAKRKMVDLFVDYARKNGIEPNWDQIKISSQILETQLIAYIARNLIDNEGFFPIIRKVDTTLKKAIEIMGNEELSHLISSNCTKPLSYRTLVQTLSNSAVRKDIIALAV